MIEQLTISIVQEYNKQKGFMESHPERKIILFIKEEGDISKYHEFITLELCNNIWMLREDCLTPEYSYQNKQVINEIIDENSLYKWLYNFISINKKYIIGTKAIKEGFLKI